MKQPNYLHDMREEAGVTTEQMAAELGVTVKTIYNWETSAKPKTHQFLAYREGIKLARRHFTAPARTAGCFYAFDVPPVVDLRDGAPRSPYPRRPVPHPYPDALLGAPPAA